MRGQLLLLMAALGTGAALAQNAEVQPSPAQQCLHHVGGNSPLPDYPAADYNAMRPGRVQVSLTFTAPDRAPEVTVMLQQGSESFAAAVREHAKGLRVPCLAVGAAPVQLHKDFIFSPGTEGVSSSETLNPQAEARRRMLSCVVHAQGWKRPEYPRWAQRAGLQGRVLVRAHYSDAEHAPTVEVFSRPYAKRLAEDIQAWTMETRLPCHAGEPLTVDWTYVYAFEGEGYGFKALDFRQFLGHVKGIREQTLQMDTNTMGCPFDVQLNYHQPLLRNSVRVVGEHTPQRRPLLEWMATSQLDLPSSAQDAIWGDNVRITIPCVKIELKPKEKTS
jgi:hypothetical protein